MPIITDLPDAFWQRIRDECLIDPQDVLSLRSVSKKFHALDMRLSPLRGFQCYRRLFKILKAVIQDDFFDDNYDSHTRIEILHDEIFYMMIDLRNVHFDGNHQAFIPALGRLINVTYGESLDESYNVASRYGMTNCYGSEDFNRISRSIWNRLFPKIPGDPIMLFNADAMPIWCKASRAPIGKEHEFRLASRAHFRYSGGIYAPPSYDRVIAPWES